jgi:hypothetical protein
MSHFNKQNTISAPYICYTKPEEEHMSTFTVNLTAINPKDEQRRTPPVEVMVDTGAHSSWLPRQMLLDAGIKPVEKAQF